MIEQVELIGGERDGDLFEWPSPLPPVLVIPLPSRALWLGVAQFAGALGPYPMAVEVPTARYRRTTISEDTHRWRYVLDA